VNSFCRITAQCYNVIVTLPCNQFNFLSIAFFVCSENRHSQCYERAVSEEEMKENALVDIYITIKLVIICLFHNLCHPNETSHRLIRTY